MKRVSIASIIWIVFLGFIPAAFAADSPRIGVINFEKIMKESSAGKMNQKILNTRGQELKDKLEKEKQVLEEANKALERESLVLSGEKKREKEREFRIQINDFKKMQEDFANELKQLEIKLINEMQKSVFDIANDIGEKEKYLLIIERKNAGVIYIADHVDITDTIIEKYNAQVASGS
ncbi:MAG TPA: OmpH family outer membrane protein [Desulfotignum sp.]|nr:OmpH family outer membrane protein [Desulfotignum sp.]